MRLQEVNRLKAREMNELRTQLVLKNILFNQSISELSYQQAKQDKQNILMQLQ